MVNTRYVDFDASATPPIEIPVDWEAKGTEWTEEDGLRADLDDLLEASGIHSTGHNVCAKFAKFTLIGELKNLDWLVVDLVTSYLRRLGYTSVWVQSRLESKEDQDALF